MHDLNDDAFERQVADVARRAVGPPRPVDALGVARQAAAPARSFGWGSTVGVLRFLAAGLMVAAFGGFLLFSWVSDTDRAPDQPPLVGASPLASGDPSATAVATARVDRSPPAEPSARPPDASSASPAPVELAYASGAFRVALSGENVTNLDASDAVLLGPRWYDVELSDPRLSGEGVRLTIAGDWSATDPGEGASRGFHPGLSVSFARLTITNERGSWRGTSGPNISAVDLATPRRDTRSARDRARQEGSFWLAGLTVLTGDGAYEGLTAYLYFPFEGTSGELERFDPDGEGGGEPFKAVIVNRVNPGFPSEALFADEVN